MTRLALLLFNADARSTRMEAEADFSAEASSPPRWLASAETFVAAVGAGAEASTLRSGRLSLFFTQQVFHTSV